MFNAPRKSLGQNFLNDENIQRKIVNELDLSDPNITRIIEIGPGRGALTTHLIKLNIPLTLIEFDEDLATYWVDQKIKHVQVINESILDVDFDSQFKNETLLVIGNIPYNITSPILFKLIKHKDRILQSVLMMQKEVALRLIGKPHTKDYGILAIMHQLHTHTKIGFHVSRNVFYPKPKVDSSVINCKYINEFPIKIANYSIFDNIVRRSFQQRRKMIRASLKQELNGIDINLIQEFLEKRPENLSIENFINLSNIIAQHKMQL